MSENTNPLVDLLKSESAPVVIEGRCTRLIWYDGAWEVFSWDDDGGDNTTEYRGPDLGAAIDTFRKLEGIA